MYNTNRINLQQMSMVSIGQCMWENPLVKSHIKELFSINDVNGYEVSRYLEWTSIACEIHNKLKEDLLLPVRLTYELLYVVKQMGDHLYDWYNYIERVNEFLRYQCGQNLEHPDKMYWLPSGAIDVKRVIIENWVQTVRLENTCAVYFVSMLYGIDKHRIDNIHYLMPYRLKVMYRDLILSYKESHVSAYLYLCVGDINESLEIARELGYSTVDQKQRFLLFVGKGYIELVKSLWFQLNCLTRNKVVGKAFRVALRQSTVYTNYKFEKRCYDEIALFLYCQMSDRQKNKLLCDVSLNHYVTKLLHIVASRPHLDLLMPILEEVLTYIVRDIDYIYSNFINCLICDMLDDLNYIYVPRNTLVKVWKRLPVEIKKEIEINDVLEGLIEEWDLISLKILLNIPEFIDEKEQFIESLIQSYLKLAVKDEKLMELAKSVFVNDSDMESFIRRIQDSQPINLVKSTRED